MKIACIIPARYASSRLPGKPLLKLGDSPMIEWVYRRALSVKIFNRVIVATDHVDILNFVHSIGGEAKMTPENLLSGTDRVAFVALNVDADIIVNLQGDEPLIEPSVLEKVCDGFSNPEVQVCTPVAKIKNLEDLTNPNLARVVIDNQGNAIYFTRAVIPYCRDEKEMAKWYIDHNYFNHIGIYAYRKDFLFQLTKFPEGTLERIEKLEQLRILENGYKIRTVLTDYHSVSVDTEEDYKKINSYIINQHLAVDTVHEKV